MTKRQIPNTVAKKGDFPISKSAESTMREMKAPKNIPTWFRFRVYGLWFEAQNEGREGGREGVREGGRGREREGGRERGRGGGRGEGGGGRERTHTTHDTA